MMIKFCWYLFSLLTILLVLINMPSNNNSVSSITQNQLFNFRSNELFMQKIIVFNILMFFIFTILSLIIF
uniref:Preprotein-translocase subunit g n=1 Tax=Thaumatella adunca TaxID=2006976 RepID=A0A1Z1MNZ4_9FLOR|nr:preprotein-translocase subunit g [Thaumatella adunca]ARW67461.1 preprotein-translocase subunit g [Thaumatella adunca]